MAWDNGTERYWNGSVLIGVWAKKSGAWSKITQVSAFVSGSEPGTTPVNKTVPWYITETVDLGTGVEAVGLTLDSYDGVSATLDDFTSLTWTAVASSGDRSAVASGQKAIATVIPQ